MSKSELESMYLLLYRLLQNGDYKAIEIMLESQLPQEAIEKMKSLNNDNASPKN